MTTRFKGQQNERRLTHAVAKRLAKRVSSLNPQVLTPHHLATSTLMAIEEGGVRYSIRVSVLSTPEEDKPKP
jgi:hypothetical protein